jgi:hypothetical protein
MSNSFYVVGGVVVLAVGLGYSGVRWGHGPVRRDGHRPV